LPKAKREVTKYSVVKQDLLQKLHVGTIFPGITFSHNEYKLLNKISCKNFELTDKDLQITDQFFYQTIDNRINVNLKSSINRFRYIIYLLYLLVSNP
jgi:hypothetical protein